MVTNNLNCCDAPIMRINAHIASAILPTDKVSMRCAYSGGMKKRQMSIEVVIAQKAEINAIISTYGVSTTAIAKKAGVVPSTINRFVNSASPANALSALTMEAVRNAWPIRSGLVEQVKHTETETGVIKAIESLIIALSFQGSLNEQYLETILNYNLREFRLSNQLGAAEVIHRLLAFLHSAPSLPGSPLSVQSLLHHQDQSQKGKSGEN